MGGRSSRGWPGSRSSLHRVIGIASADLAEWLRTVLLMLYAPLIWKVGTVLWRGRNRSTPLSHRLADERSIPRLPAKYPIVAIPCAT